MIKVVQDPSAQLPYAIDWTSWLDQSETLVDSQWSVQPSDGVHLQQATVAAGKVASVWISGLTQGVSYMVTNHITTSSTPLPKIDDRSFIILCEDR